MKTRERAEAWIKLVERKVVYHNDAPPPGAAARTVGAWIPVTDEMLIDAGKAHYEYHFIHDVGEAADMVWQLCQDVLSVEASRRHYKRAARRLERIARRAMGLTKQQWADFLLHVGP